MGKINWGNDVARSKTIAVRVGLEDYKKINDIADKYGLSLSLVVRKIVEEYFGEK